MSSRDVSRRSAMFRDQVEKQQLQLPQSPDPLPEPLKLGEKCKLTTNCFSISMKPSGVIYHYKVSMVPPATDLKEETWVMEKIWDELSTAFNGVLVVRNPGHVFTPNQPRSANLRIDVEAAEGHRAHEVSVNFCEAITADEVNGGRLGIASVVLQYVVKKLSDQLLYQKVGRRYYDCSNANQAGKELQVFKSFYAGMQSLTSYGPLMQIDTLHRALHNNMSGQHIVHYLKNMMTCDPLQIDREDVRARWQQLCAGATVVTRYNNRIYRIKEVDFASNPESTFSHFDRATKSTQTLTIAKYYKSYYQQDIAELKQPLLMAMAEKEKETVQLVPELCTILGLNDEMRKDKNILTDAMKQMKVAPQDRLQDICELVQSMEGAASSSSSQRPPNHVNPLLRDWKFQLKKTPEDIEAVVHEQLEVSFVSPGTQTSDRVGGGGVPEEKRVPLEEGTFQHQVRHVNKQSSKLDDWLFIFPEADVPVLDIWLRSLRDIAKVAYSMKMADPVRLMCTNQRAELEKLLESNVTPRTQMILLLTPQADCKKVYEIFKRLTTYKYPCVTQVVKSETIRRRSAIASILNKIVLQMYAKFLGMWWSVDLSAPLTAPLMTVPTMVIGVDVYQSWENGTLRTFVGFAASLNAHCTEYFSKATQLDTQDWRGNMSERLQELLKEAVLAFAQRNAKLLPEHFIVYRASSSEDQWAHIRETEVDAFEAFFTSMGQLNSANSQLHNYTPSLTFVAISKHTHMRFFAQYQTSASAKGVKSPDPGTIIDVPMTSRPDLMNFYLVSQPQLPSKGGASTGTSTPSPNKGGTSTPSHYVVLYDTAGVQPMALQSLTYRLSCLYATTTGCIRMPAPAQYAKKIAHLIGTAVREDPHKRLLCTFFYL